MRSTPLPRDWVDAIFTKLAVRYGPAWMRRLPDSGTAEGAEMLELVKDDWASELAGMTSLWIKAALDALPPDAPPATPAAFRALARPAAAQDRIALPDQRRVDPEVRRKALDGLVALSKGFGKDPRGWIEELKARRDRGEALSPAQREALKRDEEAASRWAFTGGDDDEDGSA